MELLKYVIRFSVFDLIWRFTMEIVFSPNILFVFILIWWYSSLEVFSKCIEIAHNAEYKS